MWRAVRLIALCGGLAAPSFAAGAPEAFQLRFTTEVLAASICDRSHAEALVFRDGLTVESTRREGGGVVRFTRGQSSAAATADLRLALRRGRVGFERGGCHVAQSEPGRFYVYTIDWFGDGGRKNSFAITSAGAGAGPACDEETAELFEAIHQFVELARAAPGVQQAELTVPPIAFCEH
jgi:hypothetical protein